MNIFDKITDKLIRFRYFNLIFWCINIICGALFAWWFANGLYNIIEEMLK